MMQFNIARGAQSADGGRLGSSGSYKACFGDLGLGINQADPRPFQRFTIKTRRANELRKRHGSSGKIVPSHRTVERMGTSGCIALWTFSASRTKGEGEGERASEQPAI